jgi:hypothetical protein
MVWRSAPRPRSSSIDVNAPGTNLCVTGLTIMCETKITPLLCVCVCVPLPAWVCHLPVHTNFTLFTVGYKIARVECTHDIKLYNCASSRRDMASCWHLETHVNSSLGCHYAFCPDVNALSNWWKTIDYCTTFGFHDLQPLTWPNHIYNDQTDMLHHILEGYSVMCVTYALCVCGCVVWCVYGLVK